MNALAGALLAAPPTMAFASTVRVTLTDHGADAEMPGGMGMGMPAANPSKAPLSMVASPATVKAGNVTFEVTNGSKDMVHEMVVARLDKAEKPLPFDAKNNEVDEAAAGNIGEVEELEPTKAGEVSLDLMPGQYILFCNVPGHYGAGMWTELTVTP